MTGSQGLSPAAPPLRLIALEVTRRCVLSCRHCRASASEQADVDELKGQEWLRLIDNIAASWRPIVILTGGEPLLREDIYDLAAHATGRQLRVVLATCGALLDDASAGQLANSGVATVSVSLDGATADSHDAFRGQDGAFAAAMRGIESAKRAGLTFQVNTTITRSNVAELPAILGLAARLGAKTFNPFLLVPTGRGRQLADESLSAEEYERTLTWLAERQGRNDISIRVTCAPHYQRVLRQRGAAPAAAVKGCLGGQSFAFISHCGKVQACGFLEVECGDVRQTDYDFGEIWRTSPVFLALRDRHRYRGRCGRCEFHAVCGGCRGRAYVACGDYLGEEPLCLHQPRRTSPSDEADVSSLDEKEKELLWAAQTQFPVSQRPFNLLGQRLRLSPQDVLLRLRSLREEGFIRRIAAVFDSRRLGQVSTLVAACVPQERLAEVAGMIGALAGVTHNYARRHRYNLWFTLIAPSYQDIDTALADLRRRSGIQNIHALPAERIYKIQAVFVPLGLRIPDGQEGNVLPVVQAAGPVSLDATQRKLVSLLAGDLPLEENPFDGIAQAVGWTTERLLHQVGRWLAEGVIRRLGAIVHHRRLGYVANGLAVFRVPQERIDKLGAAMALLPQVSHCYRRRPMADFNYNLFAMIHGQSEEEVHRAVKDFAAGNCLVDYDVLMTGQEFAKTSPVYFT